MIPKFLTSIHKGKLKPFSDGIRTRFGMYLATLEGKQVEVTVREYKSQRSNPQNSYYFGVVIRILCDHTGYTREEMHEALKFKFLRIPGENGLPDTCISTTKLNTKQFEAYLSEVRQWAGQELGCFIPQPNEVEYDNY